MGRSDMKLALSALMLFAAAVSAPVSAQDYPTRPITLVVPYAAGGGNDVMARTVAEKMSRTLGQQIVVDSRPGAGGNIATRQVATAAPARLRSIRRSMPMPATIRARTSRPSA